MTIPNSVPSSPLEGERELASKAQRVPWGVPFTAHTPHRIARAIRLPLKGGVKERAPA